MIAQRVWVPAFAGTTWRDFAASKLGVPLGVDEAIDALRGGEAKPDHHQLARRRRQAVLGRVAMQMRPIGVGDDQTRVSRKDLARQILRKSKEQPVAMRAV